VPNILTTTSTTSTESTDFITIFLVFWVLILAFILTKISNRINKEDNSTRTKEPAKDTARSKKEELQDALGVTINLLEDNSSQVIISVDPDNKIEINLESFTALSKILGFRDINIDFNTVKKCEITPTGFCTYTQYEYIVTNR